ncbi:MAG: aspartyl/asparaginyl beta-hydroxylase domain-containing protein [Cyanobacteria bacterium J06639_18]
MQEGELWWFDNKQPHESFNASEQWRIHLIFDVLPEGVIPNYSRESHSLNQTREKIAR